MEGTEFTIKKDQESHKWLLNLSDATGRLQRWSLRLQQFEYVINHRPGVQHRAADALSRLATTGLDQTEIDDDLPVLMVDQEEERDLGVTFDAESTWTVTQTFPLADENAEPEVPQVIALTKDQTEVEAIDPQEIIAEQKEDVVCAGYRQQAEQPFSPFKVKKSGVGQKLPPETMGCPQW